MSERRQQEEPETTALDEDEALMARACRVVSRGFTSEAESMDQWTAAVANDLCDIIPAGGSTMVLVAEWIPGEGLWQTISLGLAGELPERSVAALQDQAGKGWPDDDFSRTLGHASAHPKAVCARRDRMLADDLWRECAYAEFRRGIGLYDFARAVLPFDDAGRERVIVMQIDGLDPAWRAPGEAVSALACIMRPTMDAYQHRFVAEKVTRQKLLEPLSPTQRKIVPLLAEGMTEVHIAETIRRSVHTVHDHTRAIYRALRVRSRRELRDLWLGRTGAPRPADGE